MASIYQAASKTAQMMSTNATSGDKVKYNTLTSPLQHYNHDIHFRLIMVNPDWPEDGSFLGSSKITTRRQTTI
jgi:hypothetical protein